jgi:hypothetical protein
VTRSNADRRRYWAAYWETFRAAHSEWQYRAQRRWGREAVWIVGDGPFALLAPCRQLSISLWQTREEAEEAKAHIDRVPCGGGCYETLKARDGLPTFHQIIDMRERRRRRTPAPALGRRTG